MKIKFVFKTLSPQEILSSVLKSKILIKKALLFFVVLNLAHTSFSQKTDSTKDVFHFGGAALVTNNGISLIPTLSLGKPAAIFDIYMGKGKLSFEPEFRFALEGKPWSFLFWWRYKLIANDKFRMTLGAHPAMNFRTIIDTTNGVEKEIIVTRRYLATELAPNYWLSKNISVGIYYLYSHGLDPGTTKNTHYITANTSFSNIRITNQFLLRVSPQFYYLNLDSEDGFYFSSSLSFAMKNFPLAIASIINKTIQTDIAASKSFVWNISLVYSFNKTYVTK